MNHRTHLVVLNILLAVALIASLVTLFIVRSTADKAEAEARDWKQVAAKSSAAYVTSHNGTLPKGTQILSDNGVVYVIGFKAAN